MDSQAIRWGSDGVKQRDDENKMAATDESKMLVGVGRSVVGFESNVDLFLGMICQRLESVNIAECVRNRWS